MRNKEWEMENRKGKSRGNRGNGNEKWKWEMENGKQTSENGKGLEGATYKGKRGIEKELT